MKNSGDSTERHTDTQIFLANYSGRKMQAELSRTYTADLCEECVRRFKGIDQGRKHREKKDFLGGRGEKRR